MVALSEDYDALLTFMSDIRGYPIAEDSEHGLDALYGAGYRTEACGFIEANEFAREAYMQQYIDQHSDYLLEPYPAKIDRNFTMLSKKESRRAMVPAIVLRAIERDMSSDLGTHLDDTVSSLKRYLFYLCGDDYVKMKTDPLAISILKTCQGLVTLRDRPADDKKSMTNLILERNPLLFCSEAEYRYTLRRYRADHELDERFHRYVYEAGDF